MSAYYNEIDPVAAQWLRNLIAAGHIAPGTVDERSITEISADDLREFTQCHFFAGVGVWSHALRRAGWPDDRPIWTGSCPCQPFSAAGRQKGFDDTRHLWPVWFDLIRERSPAVVLGEQVASALDWLDLVSADLERTGYAFGAADLCAAGFDGAHIRQRLYFSAVADADDARPQGRPGMPERPDQCAGGPRGLAGGMADAGGQGCQQVGAHAGRGGSRSGAQGLGERSGDGGARCGMADADQFGCNAAGAGNPGGEDCAGCKHWSCAAGCCGVGRPGAPMLGRNAVDWLFCRDGKWRPVEPGTFPLADAPAARVGRLRAYGNGLDAETATQFCAAVIETMNDLRAVA